MVVCLLCLFGICCAGLDPRLVFVLDLRLSGGMLLIVTVSVICWLTIVPGLLFEFPWLVLCIVKIC